MRTGIAIVLLVTSGLALTAPLCAQESQFHSCLTDNFILSVGAFKSSNSFRISANGKDLNTDVDFDDSLGVSDHSTLVNAQLRWRFGSSRKWSVWGQYFSNNAKGTATLTEDVEWEDVIFREGTYVSAGVGFDLTRVFLGRSFVKNEQHDFGAGLGIHNLDISAFIEGEVIVDDISSGVQRRKESASQILPNLGAWYQFSPAKRWLIHARVDWISAHVGKYDGSLWNTNLGVNFQAWRHLGFDLSWQYFNLDITVDETDWRGGADLTYSGPVISLTSSW
jgi:hypothetical protein